MMSDPGHLSVHRFLSMHSESFQFYNHSGIEIPFSAEQLKRTIVILQKHENRNYSYVELVFVDEKKILDLNRQYLGHDYLTDIITFTYHGDSSISVEGTLFCCGPQIKRQSDEYGTAYETEVLRVVIHGLLHLIGYDDRTVNQKREMTSLEDRYIKLYRDS